MTDLVFGADGGGTKTAGVLATRTGEVLAREQGGASNPNTVGVEESAALVCDLIDRCCLAAGRQGAPIGSAVLGLAGAGSPAIRDRLIEAIRRKAGDRIGRLAVETDARIALEGAFSGRPGVIVIAGTGSVVLAKTPGAEIVRIGGWGRMLGDEGSGYWIGRQALTALARHMDGIERAGSLADAVAGRFGLATREALIVAVYQEEFPIASVAPVVLEACEQGDATARSILERGAALLAEQVAAAGARIGADAGVVFLGGLIDHDTVYARMLGETIAQLAPGLALRAAEQGPAGGALLMARALLGKG